MVTCRRRETPISKGREYSLEILKRSLKMYQDRVFWGRGLKNPKSTAEAPAVDLSRLNKLRDTKTVQLFIP